MVTEHLSIREAAPVPRPERLPTPNANPEPRAMNRKRRRKLAALARKEGG